MANDNLISAILGVKSPSGGRSLHKVDLLNITEVQKTNVYCIASMLSDLLFSGKIQGGGALKKEFDVRKDEYMKAFNEFSKVYPPSTTQDKTNAKPSERYIRVNSFSHPELPPINELVIQLSKDLNSWVKQDVSLPNVLEADPSADSKLVSHPLVRSGALVLQDRGSCLSAICANIQPGDHVLDICAAPGSKSLHSLELLQRPHVIPSSSSTHKKKKTSQEQSVIAGSLTCVEKDPGRAITLIKRLKFIQNLMGPFAGPAAEFVGGAGSAAEHEKDDSKVTDALGGMLTALISNDAHPKDARALLASDHVKNHVCFYKRLPGSVGVIEISIFIADYFELSLQNPLPRQLQRATVVTLDPSCSGSGLPIHLKANHGDGGHSTPQRLKALSDFQVRMLAATLTRLPSAKRVCYSTCSVETIENEMVVRHVLSNMEVDEETKKSLWIPKFIIPSQWDECELPTECSNEGMDIDDDGIPSLHFISKCSARALPQVHRCRGFYLSCLENTSLRLGQLRKDSDINVNIMIEKDYEEATDSHALPKRPLSIEEEDKEDARLSKKAKQTTMNEKTNKHENNANAQKNANKNTAPQKKKLKLPSRGRRG